MKLADLSCNGRPPSITLEYRKPSTPEQDEAARLQAVAAVARAGGLPAKITLPTCFECNRVFDLTNATDAAEWAHGHDCEAA